MLYRLSLFFSPDFSGQFVQDLAQSFDISQYIPLPIAASIQEFISNNLIPNLNIVNDVRFNIDEFVTNLFSQLANAFSSVLPFTESQLRCIVDVLVQNINSGIQTLIDDSIQIVRQSYSLLLRIKEFLSTFENPDFTPVQGCVERLARLSFCGRCTQRIPPLCRGTCNNLVKGCLSPVYTAYQGDFRRIWGFVDNILTNVKTRVAELFGEDRELLDTIQNLVSTQNIIH